MLSRLVKKNRSKVLNGLFTVEKEDRNSFTSRAVLIFLFLAGSLFWIKFFELGTFFYTNNDWVEAYPMLAAWKTALSNGQLPFHVDPPIRIIKTSRFLANANFPVSPQLILLTLLPIKTYVLVNHLLLYGVGFLGSLRLRNYFSLSLVSFTAFFVLFNFNGMVISHIAVGHYEWVSYFFLPFFLFYAIRIAREEGSRADKYWLALVLFAILLQGGIHIVNMGLIFLALLIITNKNVVEFGAAIGLALALGLVRFVPVSLIYAEKFQYVGFISLRQFLDTSIFIRMVDTPQVYSNAAPGYWEINHYLGLPGTIFVIVFGLIAFAFPRLFNPDKSFRNILLPILLMGLLSFSTFWQDLIANIPIPFIDVERVPTRFILIPMLFVLLLACINFDRFCQEQKLSENKRLYVTSLLGIGTLFIGFHGLAWRLYEVETRMGQHNISLTSIYSLTHISDPEYIQMLNIGLFGTLIALGFVVYRLISLGKTGPTEKST